MRCSSATCSGVRSERQVVHEIEVDVAYRWFLRLKLTDKVVDA
jgi:transposase